MVSNKEKLAKLILENPELPVLCMVEYEIVGGDDCLRWMASLGESEIREYIFYDDELLFWRDESEKMVDHIIEEDDEFCCLPSIEDAAEIEKRFQAYRQEVRERVEALPWQKAIVVNIDLPEVPA